MRIKDPSWALIFVLMYVSILAISITAYIRDSMGAN